MQNMKRSLSVSRSYLIWLLAIFGALELALVMGIGLAAYYYILKNVLEKMAEVQGRVWVEDRVAGESPRLIS